MTIKFLSDIKVSCQVKVTPNCSYAAPDLQFHLSKVMAQEGLNSLQKLLLGVVQMSEDWLFTPSDKAAYIALLQLGDLLDHYLLLPGKP